MSTRVKRGERQLDLLLYLLWSRKPVSLEDIYELVPGYCACPSLSAVRRMLHRDRLELKERFGANIISTRLYGSEEQYGYEISQESFQPELKLTVDETILLDSLRMAMEPAGILPETEAFIYGSKKLSVDSYEGSQSAVSPVLIQIPFPLRSSLKTDAYESLSRAIRNNNAIEFKYDSKSSNRRATYRAEPLALFFCRAAWYLVARTCADGIIRRFNLNRLRSMPVILPVIFVPGDFDINEVRAEDIWEWGEDRVEVTILLSQERAVWLNSGWHTIKSQSTLKNGDVKAVIVVSNLDSFINETLKLGANVKILKPSAIAGELKRKAEQLRQMMVDHGC